MFTINVWVRSHYYLSKINLSLMFYYFMINISLIVDHFMINMSLIINLFMINISSIFDHYMINMTLIFDNFMINMSLIFAKSCVYKCSAFFKKGRTFPDATLCRLTIKIYQHMSKWIALCMWTFKSSVNSFVVDYVTCFFLVT